MMKALRGRFFDFADSKRALGTTMTRLVGNGIGASVSKVKGTYRVWEERRHLSNTLLNMIQN